MDPQALVFLVGFVVLYVAHHLADYPLQTDHQADHKAKTGRRGWIANQTHAATHTLTSLVLVALVPAALGVPLTAAGTAAAVAWVHTSHSLIDRRRGVAWWMDHTGQRAFRRAGGAAHVDQAAHLALGLLPAALLLAKVG